MGRIRSWSTMRSSCREKGVNRSRRMRKSGSREKRISGSWETNMSRIRCTRKAGGGKRTGERVEERVFERTET